MESVRVNDSIESEDVEADKIGKIVVDSVFFVHKELGPGLLESVYEACLAEELGFRGVKVFKQVPVPLHFRNARLDIGFRLDLLVADDVIVEIKACEKILPVHEAQLLTYLKLTDRRLGYLVNFNSALIRDGIKRMVRRQ